MLGMSRRRKLLLWGVPAILGLAVVAAIVALVLMPPSEASRKSKAIPLGTRIEDAEVVLGAIPVNPTFHSRFSGGCYRLYNDGSTLEVTFVGGRVTALEVGWNNPPYEKVRQFLRNAGLRI